MTEVGEKAPDFILHDQDGNDISLQSLRGKKVILYFYPKDDTPGCTKQACGFRDHQAEFASANTVIVGISPDDEAKHQKFIAKFDLPFVLLADTEHAVCEAYGVWKEKNMYGKKYMGVERSTFVIDTEGRLVRVERKVSVDGHVEAMLTEVQS
ncbi:MAG TPA: thioredoxin-dependent thiol peroxidase [Candidatus Latescibacteria bacterium]|jgi:peroxiredoxin Q/BCP|nr:thioredoxin-dependent thiol peroxidase [Candidatus Latescibacterota bacterium]